MAWLVHRYNVVAVAIISAAFLIGLVGSLFPNVTINSSVAGIPIAFLLAIGQAYTAFVILKRYM